ncbi:unnamed protein product [Anisakis simplex]|uniref:Transient receptor potential channel (inferred by orthology to a C. elegans protein) n=1 Tax=Anisakis simplex TaxID=6269 RepID=A0A158PN03_ANISI|nr:unnamed protein product [Anisakis simplex]
MRSNRFNQASLQKMNENHNPKSSDRPDIFARVLSEKLTGPWIEQVFSKRECMRFIPSIDVNRCGCGRTASAHSSEALEACSQTTDDNHSLSTHCAPERWTIAEHTLVSHTDAFGTLEFSGGTHAHRAHYVRLGYDSDPVDIMYLMEKVWKLEPPRLVITVHGGITNFEMRSKIVTIGIAPWGLLKKREKLIGKDIVVPYDLHSFSNRTKLAVLNDRHSYFLLVDNGTSGRYGADIILRKRFEEFIAQKQTLGSGTRRVPVVCAVLEGGTCTIRAILQYLTNDPPVPVIVCDGSGRASDLLAFAHHYVQPDGSLPSEVREQLLVLIATVFRYSATTPEQLLDDILRCVEHRELLTIFRLSDKEQDVDHAILAALLQGQNLSPADKLALTLAWNRVDIARSEIFSDGKQWSPHLLHNAMMEALMLDRVDFVNILLENGVSMKKFLTISRLEQLYNMDQGPPITIRHLIRNNLSKSDGNFELPEIGAAIEKLMGNAYKSFYTTSLFKNNETTEFNYPFNELMLWAVLTRRQEMARFMWMHGEEPMAKALVAMRLYKCMSKEAADDYVEVEISDQLRQCAEEFKMKSLDLLNHCYQQDDTQTMRLLTAELPNWGHQTCLSLAVIANNKQFLAHPCNVISAVKFYWRICGTEDFASEAIAFPPGILLLDVKPTVWSMSSSVSHQHHYVCSSDSDEFEEVIPSYSNLFSTFFQMFTILQSYPNNQKNFQEIESSNEDDGENNKLHRQSTTSATSSFFKPRKRNFTKTFMRSRSASREITDLIDCDDHMERGNSNGSEEQHNRNAMRWRSKVNAFYSAPITTFWTWSLSFALFLFAITYVLLIEFPVHIRNVEWLLLIYVISFAMEHFRKLLMQEASSLFEKIRVFFNRQWNYLTVFAILSFFVGFAFRLNPLTRHSYGRVILACDSVLWYIKVLDFMSIHPRLGPYITMAGKMILNMCYIIVLLLVTVMAFGVSRQSITYPHEKWNWVLVRNIFYKPYFMLYGEVYAGEIDTCGDEGTNCVPGGWIPPALMTIFLLISNILLINMLIAIFNNIFNETNAISQQVWLFQRYEQVLEYKNTPLIPPPFTPIAHLIYLITYLSKQFLISEVRLDEDEMRKLHDFEEDCMDDLSRKNFLSESVNSELRLQNTAERFLLVYIDEVEIELPKNTVEIMYSRWREMFNEEWNFKSTIWEIESRLESIEANQRQLIAMLNAQSTDCSKQVIRDFVTNSDIKKRLLKRNEGYTTITDAIQSHIPMRPSATANLETPSAKPSFALRQNEMLRDYEEVAKILPFKASSIITSEIIAGRRRRKSSTCSAHEDIYEMDRGNASSCSSSSEWSASLHRSMPH